MSDYTSIVEALSKQESAPKIQYPKVTLTMTCGRRLGLFVRTMRSFLDCCLDLDLIDRWVLNDDRSSREDIAFIATEFPQFEIHQANRPGQAAAINNLFSMVETEYFFHLEDDWYFLRKAHYIRECYDIMQNHNRVRNVVLRKWMPVFVKDGELSYYVHVYDKSRSAPEEYLVTDCTWWGFSLNPGLNHKPTIDELGPYDETLESRIFDKPIAKKYWELGYLRANLVEPSMFHMGWEAPANYQ